MKLRLKLVILLSSVLTSCVSTDRMIILRNGNEETILKRSELLKSKSLESISVQNDPAYGGRAMTYRALPLTDAFKALQIEKSQTLQYVCLDGFAGAMRVDRLFPSNLGHAKAYLAVEDPSHPWPPLKGTSGPSAGPFYLIWQNPELSNVKIEEWPYQLVSFEVKKSIEEEFPRIVPKNYSSTSKNVEHGFRLFVQNCFSCHTLNGEGNSRMGPDLNMPKSPTEYFNRKALTEFIRNPQSLRVWPGGKMKGFDTSALSDKELEDVVSYLQFMAKHRLQNSR